MIHHKVIPDVKSKNWTTAATNPSTALIGLINCLEYQKNAWIEIRKNGDPAFPIMITNPLLDNPSNWTKMETLSKA